MMWPAGYATQGVLHGRTGRIWNVTKRAVGVEVNKQVRLFTFLQCSNGAVTVLRCPLTNHVSQMHSCCKQHSQLLI